MYGGGLSGLVEYLGDQIMVLRKSLLVCCSVLFYEKNGGKACSHGNFFDEKFFDSLAYSCPFLLGCNDHIVKEFIRQPETLYYVNLFNIPKNENFFVACTTDKILETKKSTHDVFVKEKQIITDKPFLKLTEMDKKIFKRLLHGMKSYQDPIVRERYVRG